VRSESEVRLSDRAIDDLFEIYLYLADRIGHERAETYVSRIETFSRSLRTFSERGRKRDDLVPGIRVLVFESQAVIAYTVEGDMVTILRVIHGAQHYSEDSFD
jgi:plasmid stabilization system protein ParE